MIYHFGDCTFDTEGGTLYRSGERIDSEPQVLSVLGYLLERRDRVVSRDELFEQCWPESYVSDSSLTSCLSRIRQAIGQSRGGPTFIQTFHRRGYRFIGEVHEAGLDPPPAATEASPPPLRADTPLATPAPSAPDDRAPSTVSPLHPVSPPVETEARMERRRLSVLSCTLCEAQTFALALDPEDHYELIQTFRSTCAAIVAAHEGHVAQQSDDGLLVYFGYPQAHEDDARRAVRSGLALVEAMQGGAMAALAAPAVSVRVGIATGMMMVRSETGGQTPPAPGVGSVSPLAVRLGTLARPSTVVIAETTAQLIEGYFRCKALQALADAGAPESPLAYEVQGESTLQTRLEVEAAHGLTPFVGRAAELALLQERWTYVQEGQGQVVWIQGEAGMGKSRLVQAAKTHVASEQTVTLECRCSPSFQHTAFYPLIDLMQQALQGQSGNLALPPLERLEALLRQYDAALDECVPLLAALLSLPLPDGRYAPLTLTPHQQREHTLDTLVSLLLAQAWASPLIFVVEDLHWADPSTLEFLQRLIAQVATAPLLVALTSRPEFEAPWGSRLPITPVVLQRLTRGQTEAMIAQVVGARHLPAEVMAQLLDKTDGVPLFVEELTRMVVESGQLVAREHQYELSGASADLRIPATLYDSLMARLDRLGQGKEIAQWGAVLGREFRADILSAVTPYDEEVLQAGLAQLVDAALVFPRGRFSQAHYRFKHALIQDAAYDALPRRRRQAMHGQIAQVFKTHFPELVESQPEVLAHHYSEAGLVEPAISYWQQAGQRAAQHAANQEAVRHLRTGLELLATLPELPTRAQQELDLHMALGPVLMATRGNSAAEVEQTYSRARELCQQLGETPQLFPALRGLWRFYQTGGRLATAREVAEQLLSLSRRQPDAERRIAAHVSLGYTLTLMGAFTLARTHLEQGSALTDPALQRTLALRYGQAPGVQCLGYAAMALWCLGYPDQGLAQSQAACTLARELEHPLSMATALWWAVRLHLLLRKAHVAREQAEALIALSTAHTLPQFLALGRFVLGWALVAQGRSEEGVALMRQSVTDVQTTGNRISPQSFLPVLAEVSGTLGQVDAGLHTVTEGLGLTEQTEVRWYEGETYRIKGILLLRQAVPDEPQAEVHFHRALDIARAQQAKSWELRAATSLARLWQRQGKRQDAYDLLVQVYEWFTEGFDTADLKEAKALLDGLGE